MARNRRSRIVGLLVLLVTATSCLAMAPRPQTITLLVVPARFSVLQIAFDVSSRRPAVIVSYQGDADTEEPLLHAWDGNEWKYVSNEDYEQARFLQRIPTQVILVGDEHQLPEVLVAASSWCPLVMSIPSIDTATLINSLGKVFGFRSSDWKWFSNRYNLDLLDLNADERKESWYDGSYFGPYDYSEPMDSDFELPAVDLYDEDENTEMRDDVDVPDEPLPETLNLEMEEEEDMTEKVDLKAVAAEAMRTAAEEDEMLDETPSMPPAADPAGLEDGSFDRETMYIK